MQEKALQDTTLGTSPPILPTELSTEIVGKTEILFRNGGLGGNCGVDNLQCPAGVVKLLILPKDYLRSEAATGITIKACRTESRGRVSKLCSIKSTLNLQSG